VFSLFAAAALALATLGLYGIVAGSVAERTREIGLRSALGATRGRILALIVRQGMTLAAMGIAIGLAGAAAASRGLSTLLFGVDWLDTPTYVAVMMLVVAMAAMASLLPAWRAARLDPTLTLRSD
jgi:ABC-type antimicrobial peptide transport system permease subunit